MKPSLLADELHEIARDQRRCSLHAWLALWWLFGGMVALACLAGFQIAGWDAPRFFTVYFALIGAGAFLIVRRTGPPLEARAVAKTIETDDPRLNSLLLAALDQHPSNHDQPLTYLQERVILEALERNRRSPWGQKFIERRFITGAGHALALLFFCATLGGIAFFGPNRPGGNAGFLRGLEVSPGSIEMEKGAALAIMAKFAKSPGQEVRLRMTTPAGIAQVIPMSQSLADPVFRASLPEVREGFKYVIEYGAKKSPEFAITVFDYPALLRADATLTYPGFTGLPPKTIEETRRLSAVEGTVVELRLQLNKPVSTAGLRAKDGTAVPLTVDKQFPNIYHARLPLEESAKLFLDLKDTDGRTNKTPHEFVFDAVPNKPAELKIAFPRGDQRISALEELTLQAEARDDFGLGAHGLAYSIGGGEPVYVQLGAEGRANEKKAISHVVRAEKLGAKTDQLLSYFAWAEDRGPQGEVRRTSSDMFFAEIRPFEEIFRKGAQQPEGGESSGQGQPQSQGEQLAELQKQIINATWKLQRAENKAKPSAKFQEDLKVIRDGQAKALAQAKALEEKIEDPRMKPLAEAAIAEMVKAVDELAKANSNHNTEPLPKALGAEQAAYQALLKLQAREYQVSRGRSGGGGGAQQRAQQQLDQLDLQEEKNRYETQTQAAAQKTTEQREESQVLNRLKEMAQRQSDVSERLKELQAALQEAKSEAEKEELRRRLKRLSEEQRELVQDMDELNQRMAQPDNQARMAEARQQLDQARSQAQKTSEQMERDAVNQALNSSTRAERDLKKMSEDFRRSSSQRFSETMRDMRQQARELSEQEKQIAEKIEAMKSPTQPRKSLADTGGKEEVIRQLSQQKTNLSSLVEQMKRVSEEAETPEPLLSQKLYETLRQTGGESMDRTYDTAAEFLRRNFAPQAAELEQRARKQIEQLKEGVDQAARRLLGDESEALRTAGRELDDLARRVQNENSGGKPQPGGQQQAQADGQSQPGSNPGTKPGQPEGQPPPASGQAGTQAAQGAGQPGQQAAQSGGQPRQPGGQTPGEGQVGSRGQAATGQPRQNFFDQPGERQTAGERGGRGNEEGPITGGDFRGWADRLRDVESMVDDPNLRNELNAILDRAREMRAEFKRHSKAPEWNLLESQVVKPLTEVRRRVAEELARRESTGSLVPLDRDPVPSRYSELVSRYYEQLGQGGGAPNAK